MKYYHFIRAVLQHRLLMLKGISGSTKGGGWTKLHNEELHNLSSSPYIYYQSAQIKWNDMEACDTHWEMENILFKKPLGKSPHA
jgi:hypothetical protein